MQSLPCRHRRAGHLRPGALQDDDAGAVAERRRGVAPLGPLHRRLARRCHRGDVRHDARRPGQPRPRRRRRCRRAVAAPRRGASAPAATCWPPTSRRRCSSSPSATHAPPAWRTSSLPASSTARRCETLPPASFDAVISRVGLIYFPDQQRALAGMKAALKPGGRIGGHRLFDAGEERLLLAAGQADPRARPPAGAAARPAGPVLARRRGRARGDARQGGLSRHRGARVSRRR